MMLFPFITNAADMLVPQGTDHLDWQINLFLKK